jgi:hypothetical protein
MKSREAGGNVLTVGDLVQGGSSAPLYIFAFNSLQHGCPALPRHGVLYLVLFVAGVYNFRASRAGYRRSERIRRLCITIKARL